MARGKLFESWSFKLELPAPFDDPQYSGQKDHGLSMYNTAGAVRKASLHAPTLRALLAYSPFLPKKHLRRLQTPLILSPVRAYFHCSQ